MTKTILVAALLISAPAWAQDPLDAVKKEVGSAAEKEARKKVQDKVNAKLLAEGRKNQCSFKKDTDVLAPGCDAKLKKLASALVDAKANLEAGNVKSYKFVVYGHTDTTGDPAHNKKLSEKRAQVIVKELVARGVSQGEIEAVGMGADQPLVKPDNTPKKQAKNRRYEIQVQL